MVIYADVLIVVNLYINYFLVRCTCLALRRKVSSKRMLGAAAAGAFGALAIFLPQLHPVVGVLYRAALGLLVTFVLFGRQKRIDTLISLAVFLAVSFGFAGGMTALWYFAAPVGMYCSNGTAYFNVPIWAAAVITAALYGGFRAADYIIKRRRPARHSKVTLKCGGREITLDGLADTGNTLRDGFSGKPVVAASLSSVRSIAPPSAVNYSEGKTDNLSGLRLVACNTVTATGLMPVFSAEMSVDGRSAEVLVGIAKQEISGADCIFNPDII